MSFLGKEYKFEKDDNFDQFVAVLANKIGAASMYKNSKPTIKLVKNGETYTLTSIISPELKRDSVFTPGVKLEETVAPGVKATSTFTIDGNVLTQVQIFPDNDSITFKREFFDNKMIMTTTTSLWDGVATRTYTTA